MIGFLKLAVIGTVLLGVAHGASIPTTVATETTCTQEEAVRAMPCIMRLGLFLHQLDELHMNNKTDLADYKKECQGIVKCIDKISCSGKKEPKNDKMRAVEKHCDAITYVADDFSKCSDKLNEKKSKCFGDWDPIPNNVHLEKKEGMLETIKSEVCKTYFGKDDCMKKEVTETCGKQEWDSLKDKFIGFSSGFVGNCDFSRLG